MLLTRRQTKRIASLLLILCMLSSALCKAQVKPNTNTSVSAGIGTVSANLPAAYASGTTVNYIRVWEPQQPYTSDANVSDPARLVTEVSKSTQYFDGLGRPFQTVGWQASPSKTDIVAPNLYDAFGREQYKYLPYASTATDGVFKTDPFNDQKTFYSTTYPAEEGAIANEQFYYSHIVFEPSPLDRVAKTFAPGNSWAGSEVDGTTTRTAAEKAVSVQYLISNSNDAVRIWTITFDALADNANIPASAATYDAGQLNKTVTLDEHSNAVVEYKDKEGHVVLKKVQTGTIAADYSGYTGFLCTYYVYDDLGQLRFVMPPKAVASMAAASNWTLDQTTVNELCFRYEYDSRQRMSAKKVPGAGWVYIVYDSRDRLCFSQDGNLRGKSPQQWMYTLYDDINRPVETGIISYTGTWAALITAAGSAANTTASAATAGTGVNALPADLAVNSRDYTINPYNATNSITFQNGFTTEDGADFKAEIISSTAPAFTASETINMKAALGSAANYYPLTYSYYDNYSFSAKSYSTSNNSQLDDGGGNASATLEALPTAASAMIKGMVTGTWVRVIENPADLTQGAWMETVSFYDDKGRAVQTQSDNYKGGQDVATTRYNFTGRAVATYLAHSNPAGGKSGTNSISIKTSLLYDHAGRLTKTTKQFTYQSVSYSRITAQNSYDALGQLKEKKIGQKSATNVTPMEDDNYTYNIRGWLKGVNYYNGTTYASLVNSSSATAPKWFAFDLSYDWGMGPSLQYNGNIAGQRWKSAGDGKERAYGYSYDAANRLMAADFTQYNSSAWGNDAVLNFNVKMGDGAAVSSAYDENGNIVQMQQWGLAGVASSQIDNLAYTYSATSNKLLQVKDNATQPTVSLGDFNDKNTSGDDYGYDVNGNLVTDKNKRMNGVTGINQTGAGAIVYNHLNLPWQITVKNDDATLKGTITYIYDAAGNKLEKRVNEAPSSFNGNTAKQTTTDYIAGFVYENNVLQFTSHEEGRIRMVQTIVSGTPTTNFVYDYFLKDHLGNVRMVLTDEVKQDVYPAATLESAGVATEKLYYDIQNGNQNGNVVSNPPSLPSATGGTYYNNNGNPPYNTNPTLNTSAQSAQMYKLNGASGVKTGLGITLKVMTGDNVVIYGKSYYHLNTGQTVSNNSPVSAALLSLLTSFAGGSAVSGKGVTGATLNTNTPTTTPLTTIVNGTPTPTGNVPKAGINWILFDDQFRPVATSGGSGYDAVSSSGDVVKTHMLTAKVIQNGYLYVYCSDESNIDVLFDNLQLIHNHGPLTEETHYYPFGLTMAGISDKAAGSLENKKSKFQGQEFAHKEFSDGSGLEMYEFKYRMDDPQTGRFWQTDPLAAKYVYNSTYAFAENRVIDGRELEGLEWASVKDEKGVTTSRQLTVSINNTSNEINGKQLSKLVEFIKNDFSKTYGQDGAKAELIVSDNSTFKVTIIDEKVTSTTDADGNESVTFTAGHTGKMGETQDNSFTLTASVNGDKRSSNDMARSFEHEAGHTAGLKHPFDPAQELPDIKQGTKGVKVSTIINNLMNSDANKDNPSSTGKTLLKSQFNSMDNLIQSQKPK